MEPEILGPILELFRSPEFAARSQELPPTSDSDKRLTTSATVYQPGKEPNRAFIHRIMEQLALPGSGIVGIDHLRDLADRSARGVPCLILMEHYSNFDIPCLDYLLRAADGEDIADRITAIAGMKLNEESPYVHAFAEAYTRIVIYPSRSLLKISDPDALKREQARSREINMAATRQMIRLKHEGHMILVFPSGTRYREGEPDTKRGVKEVDSYLKSFESMVLVSIAGNVLRIHPTGDMNRDLATRDLVVLNVSEPLSCAEFRDAARMPATAAEDAKQAVADAVMARLETLHAAAEAERVRRLNAGG
ncbi:MAG: 1-acyl-sn-glycerol-3-phosphate acyltransferase [Spirochaetaceae bacterium]|nr:MAG: 1-acyl-sn-glycerol-3-phosphate acyltransferase [Spirochaetaceae bacterium]